MSNESDDQPLDQVDELSETSTSAQTDNESVNSEPEKVNLSKRQKVKQWFKTYVNRQNVSLVLAAVTSVGLVVGTGYTAKRYMDSRSMTSKNN